MNIPPISAVLADVDGTLVTKDKVLTERAIQAVESAARARHRLHHLQRPAAPRHADAGRAAGPDDADGGVQRRRDRAARSVRARRAGACPTTWCRRSSRPSRPTVSTCGSTARPIGTSGRVEARASIARRRPSSRSRPSWPRFDGVLTGVVKIVGVSDDHDRVAACEAALQTAFGDAGLGGAVAALLPRRHASDGQQGRRHRAAGALPENPDGGDRHDRRPAERRADVQAERPERRHGQRAPRTCSGRPRT